MFKKEKQKFLKRAIVLLTLVDVKDLKESYLPLFVKANEVIRFYEKQEYITNSQKNILKCFCNQVSDMVA